MFRSAANKSGQDGTQRPSTSNYTSFRDIHDQQSNGKRKIEYSSSSNSEQDSTEIIFERHVINTSSKKKRKQEKKAKKEARKEERKASEKRDKKRGSSKKKSKKHSADSDIEVLSRSISLNDDFVIDRSRKLNNYNYKFERAIKAKPLRLETNLPLTSSRNPLELKILMYGDSGRVEPRYYDVKTREKLQTNPTERVFRSLSGPLFVDGVMEISKGPYDPIEEGDYKNYDNNYYDFSENLTERSRKFEKFETMSAKKRIDQIRTDIKIDNGAAVNNWLEFLQLEDEEFACVSRVDKSTLNRNSFLERRLEIIKEGLGKVRRDESLKLHLEYLNTLTELKGYFDDSVIDYWKKMQNIHLNSLELWEAFIQQLIHNSSSFKLKNALTQFDMAIFKLTGVATGEIKSHKMNDGTVDFIIELVVNRSRLLMESGHVYIVVAIVQAVAEFQFFMPDKVKPMLWKNRLNEFDKFTKTGIPRIGDKNSRGWKNSDLRREGQTAIIENEIRYETELTEKIDELERTIIESLPKFSDTSRLVAWSELEQMRSKHCWKPLRPVTELFNDDVFEWSRRLVKFDGVQASLLPFSDKRLALKLLLRLLKILGAVIPGYEENTQSEMLHSILPNDFNFLQQNYAGLPDFLVEFMFQLCDSADIVEIEQILLSIIATKIHFMELENEDSSHKMIALKELEDRVMKMKIDLVAKHCALMMIHEGYASCLEMRVNLTGLSIQNVFDNNEQKGKSTEQKLLENAILMLNAGDPCNSTNSINSTGAGGTSKTDST